MVEALPFMVVLALWFVSTGLVAMISHRLRASFGQALLIACGCALLGLTMVVGTAQSSAIWAVYASFFGGLLIWSWHEIAFLTGAVAGSHRNPCPVDATRWQRFSLATMALIHHEVALAMTAVLLLALGAVTANATGAYAFALLLIFRLASKVNIYWGVPNFSDELLPRHLGYLRSYFGARQLHPLLLLTIAALGALAVYFAITALNASQPGAVVQASLLCCLTLLAALEHLFMALPFRDSALWGWALNTPARSILKRGNRHEL